MRILVAEDEPVSQRLLVRVLTSMGHEVVAASDGEEAWRAFKKQPFRVVVTDWMMPGTDGLELTRRIRAARAGGYTWIVMLTAMDFGSNFRRAMEDGVDDFLTKPLDHELLRVRLSVAERILHMGEQVDLLASALPICMHCKAVRDGGDSWKRVEDFFHDIDFSHGYCPDCYYDHSLAPELERYRKTHAPAVPNMQEVLDGPVIDGLLAFEEHESPGLLEDLVQGLVETSRLLRADLVAFGASSAVSDELRLHCGRFRGRCMDFGAGAMIRQLDRVTSLSPEDQLKHCAEISREAQAALDALVDAVLATEAAHQAKTGSTSAAR
ncbi:MAG TPA: response regulator [Planctomycetota bacterium]|nr:response regulator [Planctomycetota bacterium]